MANEFYDKGREGILDGTIDWDTDDIRLCCVDDADYTFDPAHEFLSSVPVGARVHTSSTLTGRTATNGVAGLDAYTTASGVSGDEFEHIIFFSWSGADATSRLIYKVDEAAGLPYTPNGGIFTILFNVGPNKLFKI